MEILMNLLPTCLAHRFSYKVMTWPEFSLRIPVLVDTRLRIDSHIDKDPKVCKNLGRSDWFPGTLVVGVLESDVFSS